MSRTDLLGRELGELELEVLDVYERLQALSRRDNAPPCLTANARFALASVWQIVNDLNLGHDLDD